MFKPAVWGIAFITDSEKNKDILDDKNKVHALIKNVHKCKDCSLGPVIKKTDQIYVMSATKNICESICMDPKKIKFPYDIQIKPKRSIVGLKIKSDVNLNVNKLEIAFNNYINSMTEKFSNSENTKFFTTSCHYTLNVLV